MTDVGMTGPARLRHRGQGRPRDPPHAHGNAGPLRDGGGRRPHRGRATRVRRVGPRYGDRAGTRPVPLADVAEHDEHADEDDVAREHEPRGERVELERELPVARREPELRQDERDREQPPTRGPRACRRREGRAARARSGTAARAPSRARRTRPRRRRSSERSSSAVPGRRHQIQTSTASWTRLSRTAATAGPVPSRFCEPWLDRISMSSPVDLVGGQEEAGGEALDLQRPAELPADAVRDSVGRKGEERDEHEEDDGPRARRGTRAPRGGRRRRQTYGEGERSDHAGIELDRHRHARAVRSRAGPAPRRARPARRASSVAGQRSKRVRTTDPSRSGKTAIAEQCRGHARLRGPQALQEHGREHDRERARGSTIRPSNAPRYAAGCLARSSERGQHENRQRPGRILEPEVAVGHLARAPSGSRSARRRGCRRSGRRSAAPSARAPS